MKHIKFDPYIKSTMDTVKWSDLPKELWPVIGKFLHTRVDVVRFRSVCSLWRSSRPPFQRPLPHTFSIPANLNRAQLSQSTTYRMESLIDPRSKPWLMKLEEDPTSGQMRVVHPVTSSPLMYTPNSISKVFSLLQFHLVELHRSYVLKYGKNVHVLKSVQKLVVMPCNHLGFGDECVMFMVYNDGRLGFMRVGDEKWTHVDQGNSHYDDIIVYKDQCYVVDKWGTVSWISSALQVIQFSPPLCGFGGKKHFVECCDDLYVVDQYFEEVSNHDQMEGLDLENDLVFGHRHCSHSNAEAIDFKVYKLDQEWGKWVDVKDLGDNIFILSNDVSFSVSAREFAGVNGNCIVFVERAASPGRAHLCDSRVFNLEDGKIRNLESLSTSQMFQTPPSFPGPQQFVMLQMELREVRYS